MRATNTRNFTRLFGPPKDWNEARDGICDTIEVRLQTHGERNVAFVSTWKPSDEEIAQLVHGGVIELSILGGQPAVRLDVLDPVEVEPRPAITINEEAHGL